MECGIEAMGAISSEVSAVSRPALPISVSGVSKSYGDFRALVDVSIAIEAGEFITLLGPSGSGKTTLLMVLAGFVRAQHGRILFGQEEVIRTPPHRRNLGVVFQNYALFPHLSVAENVAYPLKLRGVARSKRQRRVEEVLAIVQLENLGNRRIDELSGGQRQRVALARAISFEPQILLMDEPLSALDKNLREHMQLEIKRLHNRLGTTTVYVTHDQREALTMSDRIAVMCAGRIVQIATPRELYERPNNRFVADFIGQSYFLPIEGDGCNISLWGRPLRATHVPANLNGRRWVVLRPEKLELIPRGSGRTENYIDGLVKEIVFQGDSISLYVVLRDGTEISVQRPASHSATADLPDVGSSIQLNIHPDDVCIVGD
jgi:putative spermidine/putrescine transport system ATP-binding protein